MIFIRAFQLADIIHMSRFLALAAHEDDAQIVFDNPNLARYIENFGRDGDCAMVAQNDKAIIGMAWARFWASDNRGFAWIDEQTPELAIAVEDDFRGQGIGARLIEALKFELHRKGVTQIALNVRADSRAVRLYQRLDFDKVRGSERTNRTGGISFNMLTRLS